MNIIEIDFEVYKQITIRRSTEDITANDVLRELLGLPELERSQSEFKMNNGKKPWATKGISFQHGTKFQAEHKGEIYSATVDDGALLLNGKRYASPSSAACAVTGTSRNGWTFWECQAVGEDSWEIIANYRTDHVRKAGKYKYKPLEDYLNEVDQKESEVIVSFKNLQDILGFQLPDSAYEHTAWWSNQSDTSTRPQARSWMNAGFRVDEFDQSRDKGWVSFKR